MASGDLASLLDLARACFPISPLEVRFSTTSNRFKESSSAHVAQSSSKVVRRTYRLVESKAMCMCFLHRFCPQCFSQQFVPFPLFCSSTSHSCHKTHQPRMRIPHDTTARFIALSHPRINPHLLLQVPHHIRELIQA